MDKDYALGIVILVSLIFVSPVIVLLIRFMNSLFLFFSLIKNMYYLSVCRNAVKALQILSLALLAKLIDLKKQKKRWEISNQHSAIPFLGLKS